MINYEDIHEFEMMNQDREPAGPMVDGQGMYEDDYYNINTDAVHVICDGCGEDLYIDPDDSSCECSCGCVMVNPEYEGDDE